MVCSNKRGDRTFGYKMLYESLPVVFVVLPNYPMCRTGLPTILTHLSESKKGIENEEGPDPPEAEAPTPCAEPEWLGVRCIVASYSIQFDGG